MNKTKNKNWDVILEISQFSSIIRKSERMNGN